ncbi:murein hydrolase activator EnvC family protein [Clostridium sp. C105KSO13]|uniref:murein hydrolase activator EnvC family protein n=1 Tax=Clostridium sp. C105KSO13 TaxID=1776045 RepID=UPI00074070AD|nr:M23 family metallopeptidase [Clostridium sp. C105KSO13]CUX26930.1 Stage II sporulation protein Q [Clostridium sp. C105KSO13]
MNKNKNEKPFSIKGKGAAVGIVICFVAVIVMVGAYTFNNYEKKVNEQLAKAEEETDELTKEKSEATTTNDIVLPEAEGNTSTENDTAEKENDTQDDGAADTTGTAGNAAEVFFDESSQLTWPASGAVLINYSMDQTVYFSTLEQYKYNPALVIGGDVGEEIGASAAGVVSNIEQTAQTGVTVTLDMGNGYSAVYGQLKEVPLEIGDYVAAGETVGYMSEPTKYYSVEGPNLYFELLKDGDPVNPMDFMES